MNTQKPEKLSLDKSGDVEVHSIFPTIQGEGIFAGEPATFIRLTGCNLRCPSCDTEYTSIRVKITPEEILHNVMRVSAPNTLVVITGGEPFRQHLDHLTTILVESGYRVQFETNGTLPITFDKDLMRTGKVFIMCSPKTGRIHEGLAPYVSAYKYVINYLHVNPLDGLPSRVLDLKAIPARPLIGCDKPIYVQPMDSKDASVNYKNLKATMESCLKHGYQLCLQLHKIIDVE